MPPTPPAAVRPNAAPPMLGGGGTGWLALLYPVLTRVALHYHSAALTLLAAFVLTLVLLLGGLLARRRAAWITLLIVAAALAGLAWLNLSLLPLYLPPVLLNVFLGWFFGRTLVRGSRPLIQRMAWHMHDREPLSPGHLVYTRQITVMWTTYFIIMAAINLLLALFAHPNGVLELFGIAPGLRIPQTVWFWFANVFNFGLAALLMVGEFAYRQMKFPEDRGRYGNFVGFMQRMRREMPTIWHDLMLPR